MTSTKTTTHARRHRRLHARRDVVNELDDRSLFLQPVKPRWPCIWLGLGLGIGLGLGLRLGFAMTCSGHGHLCLTGCRNSAPTNSTTSPACAVTSSVRVVTSVGATWGAGAAEGRTARTWRRATGLLLRARGTTGRPGRRRRGMSCAWRARSTSCASSAGSGTRPSPAAAHNTNTSVGMQFPYRRLPSTGPTPANPP